MAKIRSIKLKNYLYIMNREEKIKEVLERGVENVYPGKEILEKVLRSSKKLKIYTGIDPTGKLHIGHGVVLNKLKQLQELGHQVIVLIGDFTAMIGDPTDKSATRKPLTKKEIQDNYKDYKKQVSKILNTSKVRVKFMHNDKWSNKLKPVDMLNLASNFTVAQLLERDMFQERIKAGKNIGLHEFLYPLFQAYDAVTMDVDMQVGGNDQTFNMLAGRTLMKKMKGKEKFVLTTKLLVDPTGKKMGKTEGNMINLDDKPEEMYGKVMSWPDNMIALGFELATNVSMNEVNDIVKGLADNNNPKNYKMQLAESIVAMYHGPKAAREAESNFKQVFQEKLNPDDIREVKSYTDRPNLLEVLIETGLVKSRSEGKRLILQGGIKVDGKRVGDENYKISAIDADGVVIQKGKRHFVKIVK